MWTIINLKQGYYQIPLRAPHRDITAFRALGIRYRWRVMPNGAEPPDSVFRPLVV